MIRLKVIEKVFKKGESFHEVNRELENHLCCSVDLDSKDLPLEVCGSDDEFDRGSNGVTNSYVFSKDIKINETRIKSQGIILFKKG